MKEKLSIIFYLLISVFLFLFLYSFLHELGHAIIGVASGGKITEFKIGIGAHVRMEGETYNWFSLPLMNSFGAILPYLCVLVTLCFYHKIATNNFFKIIFFLFSVSVAFSLLPWVVIPYLFSQGKAPSNDDVTKFMMNSDLSSWLVSMTAVILIIFLLYISFIIKKTHTGYINTLSKLKDK